MMNAIAQLAPVKSGVIHWNDLSVKQDTMRVMRRFAEGTSKYMQQLRKKELFQSRLIHRRI